MSHPPRQSKHRDLWDAVIAMQEFDPPLRWKCDNPSSARTAVTHRLGEVMRESQFHFYIYPGEMVVVRLPRKIKGTLGDKSCNQA